MSRLIAQIMLAILLFPLAGLLYFIVFFVYIQNNRSNWSPYRDETGFVFAGLASWGFIASYWMALWWKGVQWTRRRSSLTALCFVGAALAGAIVGGILGAATQEEEIAFFVGTAAAPVLWQVGTILIWRETDAERAARLAERGMAGGLVCPTCGYNLSGLKGTRCPECGNEFTLDALVASQPANRQAEVER